MKKKYFFSLACSLFVFITGYAQNPWNCDTLTLSGSPGEICSGQSIVLMINGIPNNPSPAPGILWEFSVNGGGYMTIPGARTLTHAPQNQGAHKYRVTVSINAVMCYTDSVTITVKPTPQVSIDVKNISCFDASDGRLTAIVSGIDPPYSFAWSNGKTTPTIDSLQASTYTVTVTKDGCTKTTSETLVAPDVLSVTPTPMPACSGENNGSINLTIDGGTAPYTYFWSNGSTTKDIVNLASGDYTVTVTDARDCMITGQTAVEGAADSLVVVPTPTNVTCFGYKNGKIALTVSGGESPYTYLWNDNNAMVERDNLAPGVYTVTVQDRIGCTVVKTASITSPALLTVVLSATGINCFGANNGAVSATVAGGTPNFTYSWDDIPNSVSTRSNLAPTTYSLTVTDQNLCTATSSATITEPPALGITTPLTTDVSCSGGNNGSISFSAGGGTGTLTYKWSDQPGLNTSQRSILAAGIYTVTVTDANGCTLVRDFTVNQPPVLSATLSIVQPTSCVGTGAMGTITILALGGTVPYQYARSPAAGTLSGILIKDLPPNTYTITVTDSNGCTTTTTATLTAPNSPSLTLVSTTQSKCNDATGTANLTVAGGTGPFEVLKNDQTVDILPGPMITVGQLGVGTYTFTVVDQNNCTALVSATISNFPPPVIGAISSTNPYCGQSNGTITVPGNMSYTYSWNNDQFTGQNLINLSGGTYNLTVTETATNCTITASSTLTPITNLSNLVMINGPESVCQNDIATLSIANQYPGWQYSWSPSNNVTSPTFSPPTSLAGTTTYTLVVSVPSIVGCSGTATYALVVKPRPSPAGYTTTVCVGDPIKLASTTPKLAGSTYQWNTGATTDSLQVNSAGTYTVTVTLNGCSASATFSVTKKGDWPPGDTIVHKSPTKNHILVYPDSTLCYQWGYFGPTGNEIDLTGETKQYLFLGSAYVPDRAYFVKISLKSLNGCDACQRLVERTKIEEEDPDPVREWSVRITPNPGSGLFRIQVAQPEPETLQVQVYDLLGRLAAPLIELPAAPEANVPVDLTRAPAGAYYLLLSNTNGQVLGRYPLLVVH